MAKSYVEQLKEEYTERVILYPPGDAYQGNPLVMPRRLRSMSKLLVQMCDTAPDGLILLSNVVRMVMRNCTQTRPRYCASVYRPGWREVYRRHEMGRVVVSSDESLCFWDILYFDYPPWR